MTRDEKYGIIIMLLAVTEDRATQECDLSAVYGFSGKSDAMDGVALLFCTHITTLPGKPNALNSGFGQSPMPCMISSKRNVPKANAARKLWSPALTNSFVFTTARSPSCTVN